MRSGKDRLHTDLFPAHNKPTTAFFMGILLQTKQDYFFAYECHLAEEISLRLGNEAAEDIQRAASDVNQHLLTNDDDDDHSKTSIKKIV